MENKQQHISKTLLPVLELSLLFLILCGSAVQVILGQQHILFLVLRLVYTPGIVFLAGLYTSRGKDNDSFLLKHAAVYAVLFIFFGLCNQVLLNHKKPFQSVVRLITMVRIPTPSEMFFTTSVLFLCAALVARYFDCIYKKRRLLLLAGILAIAFSFFPSDLFGYPIIGVFTGCDTYDCIALLPYFGYFIGGIFLGKEAIVFSKRISAGSVVVTVISGLLLFTPLKEAALITLPVFPVYLLYLFAGFCTPFQKIVQGIFLLGDKGISILKGWYQDFMCSRRRALPLYFAVYTVMFLIMTACVFFSFIEYDNSIAWMHDAISQYIPRIHYFTDYVHECISMLLKGDFNFPSYSFRVGLGNTVPLSYEPVYWLFALFDSSHAEAAYNIITLFRFFLAGLSVSVFFLYHQKGYFESLLGSMMYAFCGFAIYAGVLHAHFIAPMIFLPLLMLATEEIFRKKRWYLCTIFVAVALPANYYFIYMSTLAMGVYYIGRFLFTKDREKKTWSYFFTTTATFAGSYLLGVVIGNISLFTSFASFMSSGRAGNSEIAASSLFYYGGAWLTRLYTYFISSPGSPGAWLKLGFIPLSYLAIVILFMKKGNRLIKFLFLVCAASCIFPIAAFVLGGFSTITNRWCYILALLVSFITVRAIPELRGLTRKELKILFISLIPYILIILMNRDYRTEYTLSSLAILLCDYVVILCMNKELHLINLHTSKIALIILCCSSLTLNAYYQFFEGKNTSPDSFAKQGHVLDEITDTPMKVLDNYPDDSFYRVSTVEIPRKNLCSSLVMDYNSIATFSSTMSGPVIDYNVGMGNTAWNLVQLGGFDNRTFMNALACVKYYALAEDELSALPYGYEEVPAKKDKKAPYSIYKNNYALPLGYTYDRAITEEEFNSYSALECQELMLQAAVISDISEQGLVSGKSFVPTGSEAKITDYEAKGIKIKKDTVKITKPGATLTLSFKGMEDSETYLVFDGSLNPTKNNGQHIINMDLSCGDYKRNLDFRSSNHTYSTGQDTHLFNLGYRTEAADSCTITFNNTGSFSVDSLKVYCQPMKDYASYIEKLTENKLENTKMDSGTITGSISVDKEKLLVLSIPYQKGWTAYVDGKETDIIKANIMYSAIYLEPGEHDIKLVFDRPGIKASLYLSAAGIVIFIIALIIRRRRIKMSK